jgi:tetratricopeptide (TPR) repeat protein
VNGEKHGLFISIQYFTKLSNHVKFHRLTNKVCEITLNFSIRFMKCLAIEIMNETELRVNVQQNFEMAIEQMNAGHLPEAEALLRAVLRVQPNHSQALHLLGVIAHWVGKSEVALRLLRQSIAVDANPAMLNNFGIILYELGELNECVAAYRQLLALQPNHPQAQRTLGNALYDLQLWNESIICYQNAIVFNPDDADLHSNLGSSLKKANRLNEAEAAYRYAIDLKSNSPNAYNNLGVLLFERGEIDQAVACYREAITLNPEFAGAHANLGNLFCDNCRIDEAIAAWRRAVELNPRDIDAHTNLVFRMNFDQASRFIGEARTTTMV